jgi:hypothetical protein
MAYSGSIQFMDIGFCQVEWVRGLRFNKRYKFRRLNKKWKPALITDISCFQRCNSEKRGRGYVVLGLDGAETGWIEYDMETHECLDAEGCVVIGRAFYKSDAKKRKYYILVVRPAGIENEYTRVGAGWILSDYVARQSIQASIV